ncbi:hypothetical protein E1264_18400 [Actinomadura sp. KC216]|uniref:hypothetical protein n=1 Tax=Actinomadura sp. KC216 TaxID=2530370 RepID=UPI001044A320|nr:hypothetical protein [Actinomadura sp. KC216]TDB86267.1 hypothetical protein E1264_18400 [Actinomadura sp. KC216]
MYTSIIRTVVPMVVALILGQAARIGLNLDEGAVTSIVTAVIGAAYYGLARLIEEHYPAAGRVLLSLGLTSKAPEYITPYRPHR